MPIGVLALQGGFGAHLAALSRCGLEAREVRRPEDLQGLSGLVLPGGESTVMLKLIASAGLEGPLFEALGSGVPVLATCAGLILLAREVRDPPQPSFGVLEVTVARNAWGRQVHSFEARADGDGRELVFIRAPRIVAVGPEVEVLARFEGEPVLVRRGSITGATYHPELSADLADYRAFFS
jgi:5'-phosphate synthase pdxT subunit